MQRVYFGLRLLLVAGTCPVIFLCIAVVTMVHPIAAVRSRFRASMRLWLCVVDWVKGIPVGYSYWEQYEAPTMLDEIAVHHEE
jgi:uncharacterized membrane protein YGL010W